MIIVYPIEESSSGVVIDDIIGLQDALDARLRIDAAQSTTSTQKVQAQQNIGLGYDDTKGGYVATIESDGSQGFVPVSGVPS